MKNYYEILGLDKTATPEEIKKAFRKSAMVHHPDRKETGNEAKFKEIKEAYETLSDPQKRTAYDNPSTRSNTFGFNPEEFSDIFAAFGSHPGFEHIFGGAKRQQNRNKTLNVRTSITLEEAFSGKELIAQITLPSGHEETIQVKIPAGIQDGTRLRLPGMGDDSFKELSRGDIYLTVQILPHTIFKRQGDDLIRTIDISCVEAMLGKEVKLNTIDNKILEVKINPGTQPGQILAIHGNGMPNMNDNRFRGRMLLNVNIKILTNLTDEQREGLIEIFK